MQNQFVPLIEPAKENNSEIITHFQLVMAKETEDKDLDKQTVLTAVQYLYKNPHYGQFLMAYDTADKQNLIDVGGLLYTYAHEVFQNQSVWWFQSVFVEEKYRGKGVFKSMFQNVQDQVEQKKYPLKLYVETENERAMKVYQKMGMYDCQEVYLEDDFYFEDKIKFTQSQQFTYQYLDTQNQQQVDELLNVYPQLVSDFEFDNVDIEKVKRGINHIQQYKVQGGVIIIRQNNNIIGTASIFYEFSDWRNGSIVYINDVRLNKNIQQDQAQYLDFYSGLFFWFKSKDFKPDLPLTCLRAIINENLKAVEIIKKTGMIQAHYRVYKKDF